MLNTVVLGLFVWVFPVVRQFFGFDLDTSGLLTQAESIFNGLQGAYIPIIGITLGLAILAYIVKELRSAI